MSNTSKYDYLWPIATERRREYIEALRAAGDNHAKAERALGVSKGLISREMKRLEEQGNKAGLWSQWGMDVPVAEGYEVDRLTITGKMPNGERYWLKPKLKKDNPVAHVQRLAEDLRKEFESAVGLFALANPAPPTSEEFLVVDFEFGDPHFGMYADKELVGEHFDTDRATRIHKGAIDLMVANAPAARVGRLTLIGDNTHANDRKNMTPQSGHILDVDPRGHSHALMAAARFGIYAVRLMLEKYETIDVDVLGGNHDPDAAFALAAIIAMAFEGNPRVNCPVDERTVRVWGYGNVGIATHHGDKVKLADLPKLIAQDHRKLWGEVEHWFINTGHIHHEKSLEEMGALCRAWGTLAGKDRWHSEKGYRALQKTGYSVYDIRYGRESYHPLGIAKIDATAPREPLIFTKPD